MKLKLPFNLDKKIDLFKKPSDAGKLARDLVVLAEEQITGKGRGPEKLDAVADALNAAIDIPLIPEGAEQVIFRTLAQLVYGLVSDQLDKLVKKRG